MSIKEYFVSIFKGFYSLLQGLSVTGKELVTRKVTEQYPENRARLLSEDDPHRIADRFRATLRIIYNETGNNYCTACRTCERACPNGTITITTRPKELPNGKQKQVLDKYVYDLGSCTFCGLCVLSCPFDAIEFSNDFEQAVFDRSKLIKQLNDRPARDDDPATSPKILAARAAAKAAAAAKEAAAGAAAAEKPAAPQPENKENQQ